jgi:hypothetical protein
VDVVDDEEGFAASAPCRIEDLLVSEARGAGGGGVVDVEGAREAEGVVEERAEEGGAVLDGVIEGGLDVMELLTLSWRPCNSFSANIAS